VAIMSTKWMAVFESLEPRQGLWQDGNPKPIQSSRAAEHILLSEEYHSDTNVFSLFDRFVYGENKRGTVSLRSETKTHDVMY